MGLKVSKHLSRAVQFKDAQLVSKRQTKEWQ